MLATVGITRRKVIFFFDPKNGPIIALSWGFQPGVSNTPGKKGSVEASPSSI